MIRYAHLHEAVAAAVRRKFPQLTVTSDYPGGEVDGYVFDLKGGTKSERDAAIEQLIWFHAGGRPLDTACGRRSMRQG